MRTSLSDAETLSEFIDALEQWLDTKAAVEWGMVWCERCEVYAGTHDHLEK